jgi:hypothetical protein
MTKIKLTKSEFSALVRDTKMRIFEQLITDEFFSFQEELKFWFPEGFDGNSNEPLPLPTPEVQAEEELKTLALEQKMSDKLFECSSEIELSQDLLE